MQKTLLLGGVALLSAMTAAGATGPQKQGQPQPQQRNAAPKRPNLLLFIADDWSYPHASIYGDKTVRTPAFDFVARNGMLFTRAFCAAPTSTASRAAILTGKYSHALGQTANLWSLFPKDMSTYTQILNDNGYDVGFEKKGWGPGKYEEGGWNPDNPAGHDQENFKQFVQQAQKDGKPFCFWYGSHYPHRPYEYGKGEENGIDPAKLDVPAFLPDTHEARMDMADYYYCVERLDYELYETLQILRETGELDNTLIIATSDNGMPFPRAKASLYDSGTQMPFAAMWGNKIGPGVVCSQLIDLVDIYPTFLTAAGLPVSKDAQGMNLLPVLLHNQPLKRDFVNSGRERHGYNARANHVGYPVRSLRQEQFLLIHNIKPDRYPGGDPVNPYNELGGHSDVDAGPAKTEMIDKKDDPAMKPFYLRAFGLRPEWELFDVKKDPNQLMNLAADPKYAAKLKELQDKMNKWQENTLDPRADGKDTQVFDSDQYFGKAGGDGDDSGAPRQGKGKRAAAKAAAAQQQDGQSNE